MQRRNDEAVKALARMGAAPSQAQLDRKLAADPSSLLEETLLFCAATKPVSSSSEALKSKYTVLRAASPAPTTPTPMVSNLVYGDDGPRPPKVSKLISAQQPSTSAAALTPTVAEEAPRSDGIPAAALDIHKAHVIMDWDKEALGIRGTLGAPLANQGNTCFLNSVLQVLTHTAPLVHFLSLSHRACPAAAAGFCGLCELRSHIQAALVDRRKGAAYGLDSPIVPSRILQRMRCFMKSYMRGRQEDAHELLRYLLDSLQTSCLAPFRGQKLDMYSKHTTPIAKIFGGYHRNEITCQRCQAKSTTYDPFMDVSLEVKRFNQIEDALKNFTKVEFLSQDNAYKCTQCRQHVRARKQYTIHRPPRILTIQLKRFDTFGKINSQIKYPERLNLRPFMSEQTGGQVPYRLFGSIVHQGGSTHSGHYYAFVRSIDSGDFFMMDDDRISKMPSTRVVLSQPAYLLFYARTSPPQTAAVRPRVMAAVPRATPSPVVAPQQPAITRLKDGHPVHVVEPLKPATPHKPLKIAFRKSAQPLGIRLAKKDSPKVSPKGSPKASPKPPRSLVPYGSDDDSPSSGGSPTNSPKVESKKADKKSASPTYNVFARMGKASDAPKGLTTPTEFLYSGLPPPVGAASPERGRSPKAETGLEPRGRSVSSGDDSGIRIKLNLKEGRVERVGGVSDMEEAMVELRAQRDSASSSASSSSTESRKKKRRKRRREAEAEEEAEERKARKKRKKHTRHSSDEEESRRKKHRKKKKKKHRHQHLASPPPPAKEEKRARTPPPVEEKREEPREAKAVEVSPRSSGEALAHMREGGWAGVRSWGGAESALQAAERRAEEPRARRASEEAPGWDEPPRKAHKHHSRSHSSVNQFQRVQDRRNEGKHCSGNFERRDKSHRHIRF